MADALATLAPAEGPEEAPLDATATRRRVEELSLKWRGGREEEEAPAEAEAARCLTSMYKVADEAMDEWDSACAAISSGGLGDLDAYLEWLRSKVTMTEGINRKVSDEIDVLAYTTGKDHELLIELGEGIMEPKKVQIFPNDVCVDILIEMLKSSREVISSLTLGWLIQQIQHRIILNALRRLLVNDANNSSHSFEYCDKEETIIANLVRGIDVFMKTSADWPLSSYGLKLISIRNSGTHPTSITSSLLGKTKELANGLELQLRRHLVRFVDSIEEILIQELRSELHAGRSSG